MGAMLSARGRPALQTSSRRGRAHCSIPGTVSPGDGCSRGVRVTREQARRRRTQVQAPLPSTPDVRSGADRGTPATPAKAAQDAAMRRAPGRWRQTHGCWRGPASPTRSVPDVDGQPRTAPLRSCDTPVTPCPRVSLCLWAPRLFRSSKGTAFRGRRQRPALTPRATQCRPPHSAARTLPPRLPLGPYRPEPLCRALPPWEDVSWPGAWPATWHLAGTCAQR